MFFIGGGAAIVLAFVLWMIMPESVRYLTLKPANEGRVEAIMWKIWPESAALKIRFVAPARADAPAAPFINLFRESRAIMTLSLWVAFFMNLLILYFIVSWMPALLRSAGLPASAGAMAIAAFSFGGILGSVAEGPLMSVFRPSAVLLVEFATFMVIVAFLTILPLSMMLVGVLAFLIGVHHSGCASRAQRVRGHILSHQYPLDRGGILSGDRPGGFDHRPSSRWIGSWRRLERAADLRIRCHPRDVCRSCDRRRHLVQPSILSLGVGHQYRRAARLTVVVQILDSVGAELS